MNKFYFIVVFNIVALGLIYISIKLNSSTTPAFTESALLENDPITPNESTEVRRKIILQTLKNELKRRKTTLAKLKTHEWNDLSPKGKSDYQKVFDSYPTIIEFLEERIVYYETVKRP